MHPTGCQVKLLLDIRAGASSYRAIVSTFSSLLPGSWMHFPSELLHIDPSVDDMNTLRLEQPLLFGASCSRERNPALRVDDAVPGYVDALRQRVKSISCNPGLGGKPAQTGDHAIGCNLASGNAGHSAPDAGVGFECGGAFHGRGAPSRVFLFVSRAEF